ncbi:hypothetical protein B296_00048566 [Ensete ventricosum]|uniref:Uncharacterized protein n=1 Tax=Ensete ventricosum TaxID=4639 RepID=A0A426XZ61_ENSVE|nr:hypothetical protein B296_00048566 [Ensete ventricosum]
MLPLRFPNSGIRAKPLTAWRSQGRPTAWRPQGAIASRGDGADHKGGRPLAGRQPIGKGSRRLRKGTNDTVRVKEG